MPTSKREVLYSTDLLARAASLAEFPFGEDFPLVGEARSRTCGSSLKIGLETDADGQIARLGLQATACAVGQAAAAIFASSAEGRRRDGIERTQAALAAWLAGEGPQPFWPDIEALAPALPHSGRHGAILLPWRATLDALSKK